jgi:hypothetical protein
MVLEWIRRHDPSFDGFLRAFLFTERPITTVEGAPGSGNGRRDGGGPAGPTATIGSLRGGR